VTTKKNGGSTVQQQRLVLLGYVWLCVNEEWDRVIPNVRDEFIPHSSHLVFDLMDKNDG
jgi:hypothetical protein